MIKHINLNTSNAETQIDLSRFTNHQLAQQFLKGKISQAEEVEKKQRLECIKPQIKHLKKEFGLYGVKDDERMFGAAEKHERLAQKKYSVKERENARKMLDKFREEATEIRDLFELNLAIDQVDCVINDHAMVITSSMENQVVSAPDSGKVFGSRYATIFQDEASKELFTVRMAWRANSGKKNQSPGCFDFKTREESISAAKEWVANEEVPFTLQPKV